MITDRNSRFDEIRPGYRGRMYLEVVPRSFAIQVQQGLSLNQLRLITGEHALDDAAIRRADTETPLLYRDGEPVPASEMPLSGGLFLSLDLTANEDRPVGFRAKRTSQQIDLSKIRHYDWQEYWEPVRPEKDGRVILEPEEFYLLLSREGVCIPPDLAAEMAAYAPTAGELRTHYAGFFDPGFGLHPGATSQGSRAALEVRARDVPFMVENDQPVCKLTFERMDHRPDLLYGEELASNYQGQETMLSKHFTGQTAGAADPAECRIRRAQLIALSGLRQARTRYSPFHGARGAPPRPANRPLSSNRRELMNLRLVVRIATAVLALAMLAIPTRRPPRARARSRLSSASTACKYKTVQSAADKAKKNGKIYVLKGKYVGGRRDRGPQTTT